MCAVMVLSLWVPAVAVVRDRRTIVLDEDVAEELGLRPGERLEASVEGKVLRLRPQRGRGVAVDAVRRLEEILARVEEKHVRVARIPERWELYDEAGGDRH